MSQDEATSEVEQSGASGDMAVGDSRLSRRATVFVLASAAFALACLFAALQFFVAEHIAELSEAELEGAKKRWQEHAPGNYDMDVVLRGAQPGNVHVEVRNGVVTAETRDGRTPPQWTWETWSVPGMFETLDQDLQIAADPEHEIQAAPGTKWRLRCEFDAEVGVPRRYHRLVSGGPEVYWRVTQFKVR